MLKKVTKLLSKVKSQVNKSEIRANEKIIIEIIKKGLASPFAKTAVVLLVLISGVKHSDILILIRLHA